MYVCRYFLYIIINLENTRMKSESYDDSISDIPARYRKTDKFSKKSKFDTDKKNKYFDDSDSDTY